MLLLLELMLAIGVLIWVFSFFGTAGRAIPLPTCCKCNREIQNWDEHITVKCESGDCIFECPFCGQENSK